MRNAPVAKVSAEGEVEMISAEDSRAAIGMEEGEEKKSNKMKKSELKEMIRTAFLNETEIEEIDMLEAEATEVFTDAELDMASEMLMNMFDKLGLENNVEKSDALVKHINSWFENLDFVNEAEGDEEEVDVEDTEEVDVDVEATDGDDIDVTDNADVEVTGDKKEVQDNLQAALEAAKALGDQKLIDQIGNSITFFTRTHIVGKDEVAEEIGIDIDNPATDAEVGMKLDESINRMQKLAGLIK